MLRLILCFLLWCSPAFAGSVAVSIKPLHSLVVNVAEGSGVKVELLVEGQASLHAFSLKPSQAKMLQQAELVFFMGDDFELFLQKILPQLPAERVAMERAPGMTLYPVRRGNGFEAHHHGHEHEHDHGQEGEGRDLHVWLSPANARAMTAEIARALSAVYPEHAARFATNAAALDARIVALDRQLLPRMAKLSTKPFAVFHDATQYFERAYGLRNIGAITLHPEQAPSSRRLVALRKRITEAHAACVFAEPQFDRRIVNNLIQGTGSNTGTLDPEGALLAPGPDLYFELMEAIAASLEACLT